MNPDSLLLIFDYGHGSNCPGKCSPDGSFREWEFNRELGRKVAERMRKRGATIVGTWCQDHEPLSNPRETCTKRQLDNALNFRWQEVNRLCQIHGTAKCLCISFHADAAAADGKWHDARGFTVRVGTNASASSKKLARLIYDAAAARGLQGNRCVPPGHYWVQSLAMCNRTKCPAALIEAAFYDNREDLALLQSDEGKDLIADAIVAGLSKYIESLK